MESATPRKGKTMTTKLIVDCSTGVTTEVELTAEEIAQREADAAAYATQKAAEDAEAAAKAAAKESAAKPESTTGSDNTIAMGTQPANDVKQPLKNKSAIKDGMSHLSPASVNAESVDPMMKIKVPGMASGYNAQKEQAYNTLASVGGGQGGDMLSQQTEMINNLKSIEPILNTAQNFLDKFENSSISKMFSGSGGFPGMSLLTGGGASASNKATPAAV